MDSSSSDSNFYENLPVISTYSEVTDPSHYKPLPPSWSVIISDLKDSTEAIKRGKYKEVNMAGVSVITAVKNVLNDIGYPYLFDGDGAAICLPNHHMELAKTALATARNSVKEAFGLDLRIGILPVEDIRNSGNDVLVAKREVSPNYIQASFMGGGINYAHKIIKESQFRLESEFLPAGQSLFQGLECRWDHIKKPNREVIAVIIRSTDNHREAEIYGEVVSMISKIYGNQAGQNPITAEDLTLTPSMSKLNVEIRLKNSFSGFVKKSLYWLKVYFEYITGKILMGLNIDSTKTDWSRYKKDLAANSDYQKFGDMMKQILSGSIEQNHKFESYLESKYQEGSLIYGIHRSPAAMVTCMVTSRNGDHIHFVDGSDGGYTMAAENLKQRMQ